MTKKNFTLDGKSTNDFHVGVSGYQVYNSPARDVQTYHIAGRNGDVICDNKCFNNRRIIYHCWIAHTFSKDFDDFRDFLMAHADRYYTLTDAYHPNHVYEARMNGSIDPETKVMMRCGEFDIEFDAKPQRYRRDGMEWKSAGTIVNPTRHECFPLLEVSGAGTVTINEQTIKVNSGATFPVIIDCELLDCVDAEHIFQNRYVELPLDPVSLQTGSNTVSASGCTVKIKPRWFDI